MSIAQPQPIDHSLSSVPHPGARSLSLALVGSGGDGVALLGDLLMRLAAQEGLYGIMVQSYGPQIRGGESAVILRFSEEEVQVESDEADLLLCFRTRDLQRFRGSVRLHAASVMVLEANDDGVPPDWLGASDLPPYRYPFARFENGVEIEGEPKNMMGLALVCRALGWTYDLAHRVLERRFGHRPEMAARNLATFDRAWEAAREMPTLAPLHGHGTALVIESGNEAAARGAMAAGMRFFSGYPITPSSEILETLIDELPHVGGTVVQAEDEIAALGMVLGASFGGVPSMTATSGPGSRS
jgi:2-oxoglutarate ferredoxin oxidoreductase subunit alpha